MKKLLSALSAALLTLPFMSAFSAEAVNFTMKTKIHSESAMVISLDTDSVIHEKNADVKQMPGPLVNIMTAVVVLEKCNDLSAEITMDEARYSDLYETEYPDDLRFTDIKNGDILTVTDLIYAMMLTSSIEASQTLASYVGGGNVSTFVDMMNEKAQEIGLENTHFTNPTGMYNEDQYTTARDMADLTMYALNVPNFSKIASTFQYTPVIPNPERHEDYSEWKWTHSNTMMDADPDNKYYYPGASGIKTGNLEAAGRSIVATASKDGSNYLIIAMKSPLTDSDGNNTFYHLEDAIDLFDWAFNHFSYKVVLPDTAELGEIPVSLAEGNDYVLVRPSREISLLWYDETDISLISKDNITWYKTSLQAPVSKGDVLGEVTLEYSGEELATVELVAVSDVNRSVTKYNLYAAKMFVKSKWFKNAIVISIVLCALYIVVCIYSYIVFKSRSKPLKPMYAVPKVEKPDKKKKKK